VNKLSNIFRFFLLLLLGWAIILSVLMMDVAQQKEYRKRKARKI
jgi:hypothetical protein